MPNHSFECPKGHQFDQDVAWNVDAVPCTFKRCRKEAERVFIAPRSPFQQLATPIVFFRYSDGTYGVAGGANSRTPKAAERVEARSLGEARGYLKQINNQIYSKESQVEERYREAREAMEHKRRGNLTNLMAQETDPVAKDIYRTALARSAGGYERLPVNEYYCEVAELDSSNREGGRGQRK